MCEHCGCSIPAEHGHEHDHAHSQTDNERVIQIQQDVLSHEKAHASSLRDRLKKLDARLVNVIGSPGCGKTELLSVLIPKLVAKGIKCSVTEGDLATDNDAKRIKATGAPAYQVMTGTACHLTAHDIEHGIEHLGIESGSLIIVENVGNLVCPSMFDLGESLRVVCLSVTEGTDKPQKYPVSFREAGLAAITKSDLLPHVDFDTETAIGMIHDINPNSSCIVTSAKSGDGLNDLAQRIVDLWKD